jgi:hypothetical protein
VIEVGLPLYHKKIQVGDRVESDVLLCGFPEIPSDTVETNLA